MKFSSTMKGRELTVIIKLLTIFGVVELRQLRLLFDYMPTNAYGKVLSHLKREGLAYFSVDGRYISTSRYSMERGRELDSVLTFWAFIHLRDRILDFCASDPPSLLSFTFEDHDYDLIPGTTENVPAINRQAVTIQAETVRLIVVKDLADVSELEERSVNDYLVLVGTEGVEKIYKAGDQDGES